MAQNHRHQCHFVAKQSHQPGNPEQTHFDCTRVKDQGAHKQMAAMTQATSLAATAKTLFLSHPISSAARAPQLGSVFVDRSFKLRKLAAKGVAARETKESRAMDGFLSMLGFGSRGAREFDPADVAIAQGPDDDKPVSGRQFACFGAGCFWGVELAYQRVPGVTKTEVGYSQGQMLSPTYEAVCSGQTGMSLL